MNKALVRLARSLPQAAKRYLKTQYDPYKYFASVWWEKYDKVLSGARVVPLRTGRKACIVIDPMLRHCYFEAACRELGVPYDLLDVGSPGWIAQLEANHYEVVFLRPFVLASYGKKFFDEVAFFLTRIKQLNMFPPINDIWFYESKIRCSYVLENFKIPHPKTYVFNDREKAARFLQETRFPLLFKTDIGSDASGVMILKDLSQGRKVLCSCFKSGFTNYFFDTNDKQLGYVLFQEYLPGVREIRVIRIGDSFFAYEKGRKGDFHSGSKVALFLNPDHEILDFVKGVTDLIETRCMSVDVFVTPGGQFLVNELQTFYGANEPGCYYFEDGKPVALGPGETHEMRVNGVNGRYFHGEDGWSFQEGDFARNAGCNLRVMLAYQALGVRLADFTA
ncbi:hypothetical protein GMST_00990 [Geomonas silvestris]|uniref:ATP-grasp domain-containing protein n=1 Tax=Geomonas silvestris TaxID=2740184 RepID=A0A6V8MCZ8_9BACT|nr:hypothetical protein [Geomonas silvestris]GFO57774.1 hypothetical protein GMST_00990 [Geomonas silvestris]